MGVVFGRCFVTVHLPYINAALVPKTSMEPLYWESVVVEEYVTALEMVVE